LPDISTQYLYITPFAVQQFKTQHSNILKSMHSDKFIVFGQMSHSLKQRKIVPNWELPFAVALA